MMEEFKNKQNPPQLSASNFANNTRYNPNINLYDHVFSRLYQEPNMKRAENSRFNNMNAYKTTTTTGESHCRNSCINNPHCTSYKYNTKNDDSNCVLYNTFPSKIISNKPNTNVGYKTNYSANFNKLNKNAKMRIQKEVANKYINNYFNTNLDYSNCLSVKNESSSQGSYYNNWTKKTNINLDPQCVYNMYTNINRGSEKFIPKYTNNSDIDKSSDSNDRLDKYYKLRRDQTNNKNNIIALNSKNNGLSQQQIEQNNKQKSNLKKSGKAIKNRQNMFYENVSDRIEEYNNYETNSKIKLLLFIIIVLFILVIIINYSKK